MPVCELHFCIGKCWGFCAHSGDFDESQVMQSEIHKKSNKKYNFNNYEFAILFNEVNKNAAVKEC